MTQKRYKQPGRVLTFTATADRANGELFMLGSFAAISLNAVSNGATGEAAVEEVWEVERASTAGAIGIGTPLFFNNGQATTDADGGSNPAIGKAAAGSPDGSEMVLLKLNA